MWHSGGKQAFGAETWSRCGADSFHTSAAGRLFVKSLSHDVAEQVCVCMVSVCVCVSLFLLCVFIMGGGEKTTQRKTFVLGLHTPFRPVSLT